MENNKLAIVEMSNEDKGNFYDNYFKGFDDLDKKGIDELFKKRFGHLGMFKKSKSNIGCANDPLLEGFFMFSKENEVKANFLKIGLISDNDKCTVFYKAHFFNDLKKYVNSNNEESFKGFYDICEKAFQLGTSSIKNYIAIYNNIIVPGEPQNYNEYGYCQLVALLPLFTTCFTRGGTWCASVSETLEGINPSLSVRAIKEIVKAYVELRTDKIEEKPAKASKITDDDDDEDISDNISSTLILNTFKKTIEKFKYARQDVNVVSKFILDGIGLACDFLDFTSYSSDNIDVVPINDQLQLSSVNTVTKSFKFDVADKVYLLYKSGKFVESEVLSISIHESCIYYNCRRGQSSQQGYKADDVYSEAEKQAILLERSSGSMTDFINSDIDGTIVVDHMDIEDYIVELDGVYNG